MKSVGREKTADEWIEFGKTCAQNGMLFLLITGGEPFIRPDFKRIYNELKKLGLIISINSNATMIDDETVEWLSADPPHIMNITLYGASNATYERLCGKADGFDKVTSAIDKLKSKNIPVQINVSLTKDNIDDLDGIVAFGKERNVPLKITSYMFNPVRKADKSQSKLDTVRFTEMECAMARFNTMKSLMSDNLFNAVREQFRNDVYSVNIDGDDCAVQEGFDMDCSAGRCSFWVTWDGRMLPCGMMTEPVTNVFENGFKSSWDFIVDEVNKIKLPSECRDCKARGICRPCGAMVHSENGCFNKKPQYLCDSTMEYINLMKG